jgi:hypothetical protein
MTSQRQHVPMKREREDEEGSYSPTKVYPYEFEKEPNTFFGNWTGHDKFLLLTGGTIIGVAGFFIVRHYYKKNKGERIAQQIVFEESPAAYAQALINAFEGMGTDEDAVYQTFADMPSQAFYLKVIDAYKLHPDGGDFGTDLSSEFDSTDLKYLQNIVKSKPAKDGGKPNYSLLSDWSQRLTTATDGMGTDEDAIYKVLYEVPDKNGLVLLNSEFSKGKSSNALYTMLEDELSGDDLLKAKTIIAKKK